MKGKCYLRTNSVLLLRLIDSQRVKRDVGSNFFMEILKFHVQGLFNPSVLLGNTGLEHSKKKGTYITRFD